MDCSLPGFSVHGISQAIILEQVAISSSRGSSQPRDQTQSPSLQAYSLPYEPPGKPLLTLLRSEVAQLCLTLCDPMNCSLQGSSVRGIFQAKVLVWVAISSSRGSFWPRDWNYISSISCIGRQILCHWATGGPIYNLNHTYIVPYDFWNTFTSFNLIFLSTPSTRDRLACVLTFLSSVNPAIHLLHNTRFTTTCCMNKYFK